MFWFCSECYFILFWVNQPRKVVCSGRRSMPTSAALDVVAKKLNLKFYEVGDFSNCVYCLSKWTIQVRHALILNIFFTTVSYQDT